LIGKNKEVKRSDIVGIPGKLIIDAGTFIPANILSFDAYN